MKSSLEKFTSRALIMGAATALFLGLSAVPAHATLIDLAHVNAHIQIDPTSQDGMKLWTVDDKNYDAQQWFWYRLGPTGGEQSLDKLTMNGAPFLSDTDGDLVKDTAYIKYTDSLTNPGLNIGITFTLRGSGWGSGKSDIGEQISIENKTGSTMDMHFFQYNNFILSNGQDTVTFDGNNRVLQTGSVFKLGELIGENTGEGIVTGFPKHEGALVSATLASLNDGSPTTFANGMGPIGPGNVSWAYQWDVSIAPGGHILISKDKLLSVVPEPTALMLLCLGGIAGWGLLKLQKRSSRSN